MNISHDLSKINSKNYCASNDAEYQTNIITTSGNIVPNIWYRKLLRPCGRSDTNAIIILSELVFLHRCHKEAELQLNYNYFADKFNFGLSQVKDAIVRLEEYRLVIRKFKTISVLGRNLPNEMFLILNIENILKLNKGVSEEKTSGYKNNPGLSKEIGVGVSGEISSGPVNEPGVSGEKTLDYKNNPGLSEEIGGRVSGEISSDTVNEPGVFGEKTSGYKNNPGLSEEIEVGVSGEISSGSVNELGVSEEIRGGVSGEISADSLYKIISIRKNRSRSRSMKSSFNFNELELASNSSQFELSASSENSFPANSLKEVIAKAPLIQEAVELAMQGGESSSAQIQETLAVPTKKLSEFYPLSGEDADLLQKKSGRDFDLNFINQLMLRLADKYPDRKFSNKKSVLSYMSKLLACELRQAVIVNNTSFKFKDNETLPAAKQYLQGSQGNTGSLINSNTNKPVSSTVTEDESVWSKVRARLISYYGEAVDRSWFSKLIPEENSKTKILNIKAPSLFLRDWVENNYQSMIRVFCEQEEYRLGQFI